MEQIETRNDIRINNQIQIFNLLRQEKMTISDLASRLNISFTAVSNIVDEMVKDKLIKYTEAKRVKSTRGRNPGYVQLDLDRGVVCGIDLSSRDIRISLCTIDCNIVASDTIYNVPFIEEEHLEKIEIIIKNLLKSEAVNGRKLLSICIASPGMIRHDNFEYVDVYRVPHFSKLNPVIYFKNIFDVPVEMHNNVRVGCLGELKFGEFPPYNFNGLFAHISYGSGISLIFGGKIFVGSNGFSGEDPSFKDSVDYVKNCWNGKLFNIWSIYCYLKQKHNEPISKDDKVDLPDLVKKFEENDPDVVEAVKESAKINATTIIALCTLLDLDCVVLEGSLLEFGEKYLEMLRKYIQEFTNIKIRAQIMCSSTNKNCATLGACYQGITMFLHHSLEKLARKRLNLQSFKISDSFKEI